MLPKTNLQLLAMHTIQPKILWSGTPVVLLTSLHEDGLTNLAPMSSTRALGWILILRLGTDGKTFENLVQRKE